MSDLREEKPDSQWLCDTGFRSLPQSLSSLYFPITYVLLLLLSQVLSPSGPFLASLPLPAFQVCVCVYTHKSESSKLGSAYEREQAFVFLSLGYFTW